MTSYLVEEKLLRPLSLLHRVNMVAEHCRFRWCLLGSPLERKSCLDPGPPPPWLPSALRGVVAITSHGGGLSLWPQGSMAVLSPT
jgi:hypothetical protein